MAIRRTRVPGRERERGAGLVLVIGVIAALAISAASLVMLTANVQSNTADTREHVKSFTVCEAGLDSGMALLAYSWPTSSTSVPSFDTAGFRDRFSTSEFPDPASGDFITVGWYDDQSPVNTSIDYDANGNGSMWMVSQANVGGRATRVVSKVERTYMKMALPHGLPLWAGGNLTSNGQGNNPKIRVTFPPPDGVTTVQVGGTIDNSTVAESGIGQKQGAKGDDITPLEEVFPQSLVDSLTLTAQSNGRYFTSLAAAQASPMNAIWSPNGGLSGLTVIDPPTATEVKVTGNLVLNSPEQPGIMMILGGSTLAWGGNGQFYGVIYCEGPMDTSHGTADIHGMVVTNSNEDLKGTPNILYDDRCISNLDNRFPSMARRVKNSWREVQPQ